MKTVGVDLAAEPKNTAVAVLSWRDGRAQLDEVHCPANDDTIYLASRFADKIGIDCPLGWPIGFREFIDAQADGRKLPAADTVAARRPLAYRVTDLWVIRWCSPLRPLSVSADRIGHAAFRCAPLLRRLDPHLDRTGAGPVAEVYPIGSLHRWGIRAKSYKGPSGAAVRAHIVDALDETVRFGFLRTLCLDNDHVLDAVIAALSAAAVHLGLASRPRSPEEIEAARVEGWIAIPETDLFGLREAAARRR